MNVKSRAGVCLGRSRSGRGALLALALLAAGVAPAFGAEFTVVERPIADLKAVFATVESLHSTAARSRNGGTIDHLSIQEGDRVTLGERLAVVSDPKLPLQLAALDARIQALLSQQNQARIDLDRMQQLMKSGNVTRANLDQAQTTVAVVGATLAAQRAERAVVAEQLAEGDVLAPANGRVLKVHVVDGTVVMPGETVADIATADYVLRMRLPERHAKFIHQGDKVLVGARGLDLAPEKVTEGRVRLVYPEIDQGLVIADVDVPDLGDFFVGERTRVFVATGTRMADRRARKLHLQALWHRLCQAEGHRRDGRPARAAGRGRHRGALRAEAGRCPAGAGGSAVKLGLAGSLTRYFIDSPLTPLLLLASLAAGFLALGGLSREEEPQISVPMVDIHVEAPGLKAVDAAELVTKPLEDIVKGINGVEHVYSQTLDDHVIVTARFYVGTDEDTAILRVHEKIRANMDRIPLGIPDPLIVGRGINDVAVVTLTLSPRADLAPAARDRWNDNALYDIAVKLQHELVKVPDLGLTYIVGGRPDEIRVEPDPERLSLYGVTLSQLVDKVQHANASLLLGALRQADSSLPVVAGQTLQGIPDIGLLLITTRDGRPVYVRDVADVVVGGQPLEHQAWNIVKGPDGKFEQLPAVTLALAKRKGANAVDIAAAILQRLDLVRGRILPEELSLTVTRNYGATANDKVNELLFHLALATVSIVLLITFAIGWREGVVVFVVIPTTILLTLFASWLMGYTINRVSLFALIFSIGILVDDAIVVVENIDRHWAMGDGRSRLQAAIDAVSEVGNPTIVATLTVIAALLPMMFVSGLMGPYMSPIPANASVAMLFSFFIAVAVTPWLMLRLSGLGRKAAGRGEGHGGGGGRLGTLYRLIATPLLAGRWRSWIFLLLVGGATVAACGLFYTESVAVKLLPFDNKSEVQVVIDLPRGSSLEATERVLKAAADRLAGLPELTSIQAYAGTSSPFNFNGLVRHSYLRSGPEQGDLQINLLAKGARDRPSHAIALDIRRRLADLAEAGRHRGRGGRGAARPAGAGDPAGGSLRAGCAAPAAPRRRG